MKLTLQQRRELAARWGCSPAIIKIWETRQPERLRILLAGASMPERRDKLNLRHEAAKRGWRIMDITIAVGWTYFTLKNYEALAKRRARLWDIIRGMEALRL